MASSVQRLGDDLCAATHVRERIRRHPLTAIGLGAVLGFVGGPLVLGACKTLLTSAAGAARPSANRSGRVPGFFRASLRFLRGDR